MKTTYEDFNFLVLDILNRASQNHDYMVTMHIGTTYYDART